MYPANDCRAGETARLFEFEDGSPGSVGLITPVTDNFCGACSRIRLTADGQIRTCLFSQREHDLRGALRSGASIAELATFIRETTLKKEFRGNAHDARLVAPSRSMSAIGG
jgi:cyclic pyranopterin phosphate synthase